MNDLIRKLAVPIICLSLGACSNVTVGDLGQSSFLDEADELRDSCHPDEDQCIPGLTDSLLAILAKQVAADAAAIQGTSATGGAKPTLSGPALKAILKKPDEEKTSRDREIEALLEELLQERRERLKRESAT